MMNDSLQGTHLLAWGDGGVAENLLELKSAGTTIESHIWKITAVLLPIWLYNGSFTRTANSNSTYNFTMFKEYSVTAFVPLPYVFLIGSVQFDRYKITCNDCKFFTCLNSSININLTQESIFLLRQRNHLWLPVNLGPHWERNPMDTLLIEFLTKILKRTKFMTGAIVAVILSLKVVAATGIVASLALQTSIQNEHFVEYCHKDSHNL